MIIDNVIGFDKNVVLKDNNGNIIKHGIKHTVYPNGKPEIKVRILNKKVFTHFNQALLDKIREYKMLNL